MRYYVAQIDYMNRDGRWQSEQIDHPYAAREGSREAAHRALHNAPDFVRKNAFAVTVKPALSTFFDGVTFAVEELTGRAFKSPTGAILIGHLSTISSNN
jgi:hypothetical protein